MKRTFVNLTAVLLGFATIAAAAQDTGAWDGLVEIKPRKLDAAYLMPGADFRPYKKLMVEPVVVAFRKDWMKRVNESVPLSRRVSQEDAEKIATSARENFAEVFNEAAAKAGYELVASPGADVLRVRPGVIDLYIAAPDTGGSGRSRSFTVEAGEATLFLEVSDSTTGALLGRALDKRATRNTGRLMLANSVTNLSEFRSLFRQWADAAVNGLDELRAMSPVPLDLKPGQKLVD